MKKLLSLFIGLVFMVGAQAQDGEGEANLYYVWLVSVKEGQTGAIKRMYEHDAKFHEGKSVIGNILNGENTGKLSWIYGPNSYADMDKGLPEGHDEDNQEVQKLLNGEGTATLWAINREVSLDLEGNSWGPIRQNVYYKIKPGTGGKFVELVKKHREVWEKNQLGNFSYLNSIYAQRDGHNILIHFEADNWVDFGKENPNYKEQFEAIHGEGSMEKTNNGFNEIIESVYSEGVYFIPKE